jgi:lysophospholipase L1-like esterase
MAARLLSRVWDWLSWLRRRGPFFLANLAVAAFMLWLIAPLFDNVSKNPVIFGRYSPPYFTFLVGLVIVVGIIISMALLGAHKLNRNLFLTMLALFLTGEIFTRLFVPIRDEIHFIPHPYVVYANPPDARLSAETFDYGPLDPQISVQDEVLNELGFRGPVPPAEKGDEYRVIILGGSTVWGGFPLPNSIAGRLESLFHKEGKSNVRVYNWGVPGYVSGQELSLLVHTVSDYKPDLVIVYDGGNDIYGPYAADPRPGYPSDWVTQDDFRELHRATLTKLISDSRLLTVVLGRFSNNRLDPWKRQIEALRPEAGYGTEAWRERIASIYAGNQRKMCAAAQGSRFELAVYLQPLLPFKRRLVGGEESIWNPAEFQAHAGDTYQRIKQAMGRTDLFNRDGGCYFFDLSNIFLDYEEAVYVDFVHVSNKGNEFIAGHIFEQWKEVVLQKKY